MYSITPPPSLAPCSQPRCDGLIESGFCNVCGIADSGGRDLLPSVQVTKKLTAPTDRISAEVVMVDPVVPGHRRFCSHCSQPVFEVEGTCSKCGGSFSFVSTLKAGDTVADQYEILGPLAFGGLGWIYLARDLALTRLVVLKGLLDSQDASSASVALAERQFLAAVKHPNIVSVYSFATRGTEGFIVMEYIGGRSLKDIRKERGPLPPAEAISYIHRILDAFRYLHSQDPPLIYCDFKPENCMVDGEEVKLIDLGGVRRAGDPLGDIYGTVGYSAPEAAHDPTQSSDLYSIGRTLAVLILEFKGFQGTYKNELPPPEEHPVLEKYDSLYRFLLKATQAEPKRRFRSADEMADQLAGVFQEVAAVEQGIVKLRESQVFSPDPMLYQGSDIDEEDLLCHPVDHRGLSFPKLDPHDPATPYLMSYGAIPDISRRLSAMRLACHKFPNSLHAPLRVALTMLQQEQVMDDIENYLPALKDHWQGRWIRGCQMLKMMASHADDPSKAQLGQNLTRSVKVRNMQAAEEAFEQVYREFPGELAPRLALALTKELDLQIEAAILLYKRIVAVDPTYISAVFGLARCYCQKQEFGQAAQVLTAVTTTSPLFQRAQLARIHCLLNGSHSTFDHVLEAGRAAEELRLDEGLGRRLTLDIQTAAFNLFKIGLVPPSQSYLLGSPLYEHQLRMEIEINLRQLARLTTDFPERIELVHAANGIRPFTLF